MTEEVKSVPAVSAIFTPKFQEQAKCTGPVFETVDGAHISQAGLHVQCNDLNTNETVGYFYPMHTLARVKINLDKVPD